MRKQNMVFILIGIIVLVIGVTSSWSQGQKNKTSEPAYLKEWFDEIDANGDGKISQDEHMKHAAKRAENRFTEMDSNKDGFISNDEFKEGIPKKRKKGNQKVKGQQKQENKQ